jgi:preprotein translocase subunit SecG
MTTLVAAVHIVVCIALVIVVLLQQGKGADVGAVFGGSSSTVFGASGAGNALTKVTWTCATLFFVTAIYLAFASTQRMNGSIFGSVGTPTRTAPRRPTAPPLRKPAAPASSTNPAAPLHQK